MSGARTVRKVLRSKPTIEGAGVHLRRAFGFSEAPDLDPFLLLDDFHSDNPEHYLRGFPWHPHRGIETITYVLHGEVEHGDSMGNSGRIGAGDVQWMTAGSGIIHQEMPKGGPRGLLRGFQLWANLPAARKMMEPRYRDVKAGTIPEISLEDGVKVRLICGALKGTRGPVQDIVIDPEYLDVCIPAGAAFVHPTPPRHTVLAYVFEGKGCFSGGRDRSADRESLLLFSPGDRVEVSAEEGPVRFLLLSGQPVGEPVAWYGPIVMNTQEELRVAFEEYENGTFIKAKRP